VSNERRYLEGIPTSIQDLILNGEKFEAMRVLKENFQWQADETLIRVNAIEEKLQDLNPSEVPEVSTMIRAIQIMKYVFVALILGFAALISFFILMIVFS
jgi:hypothetical protein